MMTIETPMAKSDRDIIDEVIEYCESCQPASALDDELWLWHDEPQEYAPYPHDDAFDNLLAAYRSMPIISFSDSGKTYGEYGVIPEYGIIHIYYWYRFTSSTAYHTVFLHELAHMTAQWLKRPLYHYDGDVNDYVRWRVNEEVVAIFATTILMYRLKGDYDDVVMQYTRVGYEQVMNNCEMYYINSGKTIEHAMPQAIDVANFILNGGADYTYLDRICTT